MLPGHSTRSTNDNWYIKAFPARLRPITHRRPARFPGHAPPLLLLELLPTADSDSDTASGPQYLVGARLTWFPPCDTAPLASTSPSSVSASGRLFFRYWFGIFSWANVECLGASGCVIQWLPSIENTANFDLWFGTVCAAISDLHNEQECIHPAAVHR